MTPDMTMPCNMETMGGMYMYPGMMPYQMMNNQMMPMMPGQMMPNQMMMPGQMMMPYQMAPGPMMYTIPTMDEDEDESLENYDFEDGMRGDNPAEETKDENLKENVNENSKEEMRKENIEANIKEEINNDEMRRASAGKNDENSMRAGNVDEIFRKIERNNPMVIRRLMSCGMPYPVAQRYVKRIISLTLMYSR